ncbi:11669_t:CDS:2 [Ambispora gerdemannii]|uniref:11669_t:CDS:1 n=1 Tax=Ambispora gerdemannii TaxID=144530 RepID=A0A9N9F703_9GLOM|nr:11669_t:CDS:2 [Ambispora gerdemannii]
MLHNSSHENSPRPILKKDSRSSSECGVLDRKNSRTSREIFHLLYISYYAISRILPI